MRQITLSGTGGQGLILAGTILAEAAILDEKYTVQTQSYGPEARGGASKSDVIISNDEIDYPKVIKADILLSMSQESLKKYIGSLKPGGKLILDTTMIPNPPEIKEAEVLKIEITRLAKEEVGNVMAANIIALGALLATSGVVSLESLEKAILARVPKGTEELNKKALALGFKMGQAG